MAEPLTAARRGDIEHGDGPQSVHVSSLSQLDAVLDAVDARSREEGRPTLAVVYLSGSRFITIGLGADETIVGLDDEDAAGYVTSHISEGDLYADEREVAFYFGKQDSYFLRRMLVPLEDARQAVRDAFERPDQKTTSVRWSLAP